MAAQVAEQYRTDLAQRSEQLRQAVQAGVEAIKARLIELRTVAVHQQWLDMATTPGVRVKAVGVDPSGIDEALAQVGMLLAGPSAEGDIGHYLNNLRQGDTGFRYCQDSMCTWQGAVGLCQRALWYRAGFAGNSDGDGSNHDDSACGCWAGASAALRTDASLWSICSTAPASAPYASFRRQSTALRVAAACGSARTQSGMTVCVHSLTVGSHARQLDESGVAVVEVLDVEREGLFGPHFLTAQFEDFVDVSHVEEALTRLAANCS